MYEYLHGYAEKFGLLECVRLRTRVEALDRSDDGAWRLRLRYDHSRVREERFERVVVGSGRFNNPSLPRIPGLESFSGRGGVIHAFNYRDAAPYRHMRVLDARHPGYGFERHKGYSTPEHLAALARLGPCVEHRRSFAPVRERLQIALFDETAAAV